MAPASTTAAAPVSTERRFICRSVSVSGLLTALSLEALGMGTLTVMFGVCKGGLYRFPAPGAVEHDERGARVIRKDRNGHGAGRRWTRAGGGGRGGHRRPAAAV